MTILYLLKHFPCLSQTFVLNEVAALTRRGSIVHVISAIDLGEAIDLDPAIAARVTYLKHGSLYRYAAPDGANDSELVREAERARTGSDIHVPAAERQRLWDVVAECEQSAVAHARGFLDGLDVLRVVRAHAIEHLHADFAEDNVKLAYIVSRATGIPFSFKMRAYDIFAEPHADLSLWMAAAAQMVTISRYNAEYICRRWAVDRDKVAVIYDGVSLAQVSPVARYVHRPFRIVSASRLVEKKGFAVLLEACQALASRGVPLQCDIYGEGPLRGALDEQLAALGLRDGVRLHGAVAHHQLLAALQEASVFVLACIEARNGDRDATPNVLLEAMARGIPVVSTRLSGIPELIDEDVNGLLVAPNDVFALADAVARIAADRELAEALRDAGRRSVVTRFTIERTVDEFLTLLGGAPRVPTAAVGAHWSMA